jgi:hypothetical protein
MKLDISLAGPTGPNGRIIERDILELSRQGAYTGGGEKASVGAPLAGYTDAPISKRPQGDSKIDASFAFIHGPAYAYHVV